MLIDLMLFTYISISECPSVVYLWLLYVIP